MRQKLQMRMGRGRTTTRPSAGGVVELTPFEFLDRLAEIHGPGSVSHAVCASRIVARCI
jgi:hypothetical protein